MQPFNGVKVFSATMAHDRAELGDRIVRWLADHKDHEIRDYVVRQSSDDGFHCLAIILFYWQPPRTKPR